METIELNQRYYILESNKNTFKVEEGLLIKYYYSPDYDYVEGVVKKGEDGFHYIEWEDWEPPTLIKEDDPIFMSIKDKLGY